MTLPKTKYPLLTLMVPSLRSKHMFRPMLVSEERILLTAKQSENPTDILIAVKQVVNNCSQDPTFKMDKISLVDLEYLFLKLRAASVSNITSVSYRDLDDGKEYQFNIDLNNVEVFEPESTVSNKVSLDETSGLVLRPPPATIYDNPTIDPDDVNSFYKLAAKCIDKVYSGEEVTDASEYSEDELVKWLDTLPLTSMTHIKDYMDTIPRLDYVIKYTNENGTEKQIVLSTLSDFFTLY